MAGWSQEYLLPTDRSAYRVRGCRKLSWKTVAEAEAALLAPGWCWEKCAGADGGEIGWQLWPMEAVDEDGWSYGTNFPPTYEGAPKKSVQSFVRWRRFVRSQAFAGETALVSSLQSGNVGSNDVVSIGCPHVDLAATTDMGHRLLEALAAASLMHGELSLPVIVRLKYQLAERVLAACAMGADSGSKQNTPDVVLADFIASQRSVASRLSGAFQSSGHDEVAIRTRMSEMKDEYQPMEREALSAIIVRRFRPDSACSAGAGEHDCKFRPISCANPGCTDRFSAHAFAAHDKVCGFKRMNCEKCNEAVARSQLRVHASVACSKREVACTFSSIGCVASVSVQQLPEHLDNCTQGHLMMMLQVATEQQETIKTLTARVSELEMRLAAQEAQAASFAPVAVSVDALDAKLQKVTDDTTAKFTNLDKRAIEDAKKAASDVTAKVSALEKRLTTEVKKVGTDAATKVAALDKRAGEDLKKAVGELEKRVTQKLEVQG
eukprot:TRINITY_DN56968_c0_g1_i1.p1 TRINITY_DN56968_c0_g1~~TRINITY_DN56968_c0_g1_i1.p1  ORF type:complete len:543 (-),score=90.67 TRINITY_DN56968_c0_g1_i1:22-1497(-)